jgi:lipoprotein NlpD
MYVVQPHDTLYSIAWRHHLDYRDLARWNHIGADFRITVGQRLTLSGAARTAPGMNGAGASGPATRPGMPSASWAGATPNWVWPTTPTAAPRRVSGGGILLAGHLGQDIRAAGAGRVVYNGSGIRGYGNLIIIKHGEAWLTAYAHNRETLVREGQEVQAGQVIAHMGEGAPQRPLLYFEIRLSGKPVDPLGLLPAGH